LNINTKILIRNFEFKDAYQMWMVEEAKNNIAELKHIYENFLIQNQSEEGIFEKGQGYEAFLWRNTAGTLDFRNIIDFWRTIIVNQGYYNYVSDIKTAHLDGGVKLFTERHYLKPKLNAAILKNPETTFGNISLEMVANHLEQYINMRIVVTKYPNKAYFSFEALLTLLFSQSDTKLK